MKNIFKKFVVVIVIIGCSFYNSFAGRLKKIQENQKQYVCSDCNKAFSTKGRLNKHIKADCDKIRFACEKCSKTFSTKGNLNRHIKMVHKNLEHICKKNGKSFAKTENINPRIKAACDKIRYTCEKCNRTFSTKGNLNQHAKKLHANKTQDDIISENLNMLCRAIQEIEKE